MSGGACGLNLILETSFTGHRSEYIKHLMLYINAQPALHDKYLFVLDEKIRPLIATLADSNSYKIEFLNFSANINSWVRKSFWEWKILTATILKKYPINEIIFMDIDLYLILLATKGFKKYGLPVKGILFQPYIHFKDLKAGTIFFIKKYVKNYLLQKLTVFANSNVKKLFVLNDRSGSDQMNKEIKNVFKFLPDPIENEINIINQGTFEHTLDKYNIDLNKRNLLLFGSIDSRKNLINIINALLQLPEAVKETVHLIIAGSFDKSVREAYIKYITIHKDDISIAYNDGYVTAMEMEVLFKTCDVVLMPYINFYSSSGILGHAIKHNKKVLASNKGLVSKTVQQYNLGETVDPLSASEIQYAVGKLLSGNMKYSYDGKSIIEAYSPFNFSKTILS